MNIIYGSDDNYAKYLGISMYSLLESNIGLQEICVYILDNGIGEENRKHLQNIAGAFDRKIVFLDVAGFKDRLSFSFDTLGFSDVILARLFMADYLPDDVDQILYLDCDTLVPGNLVYLEKLSLGDHLAAMVPELYMPPAAKKASIGFDREQTYYNSGVMLINLKIWREEKLSNAFISFYQDHGTRLMYADQDILNFCMQGRILTLPQTYNMSANFRYFPRYMVKRIQPAYDFSDPSYRESYLHPHIIHYMGDERPWIHGNHNYYRSVFRSYQDRTVWKDLPQEKGREWYMACYHLLNLGTLICPWGRLAFSNLIGINKYKWFGKD